MSWILLALRRLRDDPVPSAIAGLLVFVTTFVVAGTPGLLGRVADEALRAQVRGAPALDANLELLQATRIAADPADQVDGADPLRTVTEMGTRLLGELPASVTSLVTERVVVIETPRWAVTSKTGAGTLLAIRIHQGAEAHVRMVDGRPPGVATSVVDAPATLFLAAGPAVAFDAMVAAPTARRMGVKPGDVLLLGPDLTDPLARGRQARLAITVTGTFEVLDPLDPTWLDDATVAGPSLRSPNADTVLVDATVLIAPGAYPALLAATDKGPGEATRPGMSLVPPALPLRYGWRLFIDPAALSAQAAPALLADLRRAETIYPSGPDAAAVRSGASGISPFTNAGVPAEVPTSLVTGLPRLLTAQLAAWRSAASILTMAVVGPVGMAVAALGLVAALAATRRRLAMAAWFRRGAGRGQVVAAVVVEVLLIGLPAAAAGVLAAQVMVPVDAPWLAIALGALVLAVTLALVTGATLAPGVEPAADRAVRTGPVRKRRRLTLEVLLVLLAVAATLQVRDRGTGTVERLAGVDPILAGAPILAGLAVAVVAGRAATIVLRMIGAAAARRRGLVAALALRRSTRSGSRNTILAVLLVSAAISAFSLAGMDHLARSARLAAWQAVGADILVSGPAGGPMVASGPDPSARPLDDGAVMAAAFRAAVSVGPKGDQANLLAIDPAYLRLTAGTPIDPVVPAGVLDPPAAASSDPLPAVVSTSVTIGREPLTVGQTVMLSVLSKRVPVLVVGVVESFPSLPAGDPFVVVSRAALSRALPAAPAPNRLYFRVADGGAGPGEGGGSATTGALRDRIAAAYPGSSVLVRVEREAALSGAPLVRAVSGGLALAAIVAAAYAALALVAALAMAGAARAVEMAHLRILGVSRRQQLGLVLVEQVPLVAFGYAVGIAAGLAFFIVVLPGLGLGPLVGMRQEAAPALDLVRMLGLAAALTVVAAIAILTGTFLEQRATSAVATRKGIE